MAILDFFKKKERRKKLEAGGSRAPIKAEPEEQKEGLKEIELGSSTSAGLIFKQPHITEKSAGASEAGVYVFRVHPGFSKPDIKKALQDLYKVKVVSVNIISVPSRRRRVGRKVGVRPGYKKALIKLAEGQKIEFV